MYIYIYSLQDLRISGYTEIRILDMHTFMYICIHIYIHIYTIIYTYICIYMRIYIRIYIHTYEYECLIYTLKYLYI
jgi:hypothetical protein